MSQYKTDQRNHVIGRSSPSKLSPFTFARYTIPCERHPNRNEDSMVTDEHSGLAAVFDGVGGSAAGEVASQTAANATRQFWKRLLQQQQKGRKIPTLLEPGDQLDLNSLIQEMIQESDEQVRKDGAQRAGTDDLATTVALVAICHQPENRGYTMFFAHVGDSRVYLLPQNGQLKRLTSDDGLLAKLVENQMIGEEDAHRIDQVVHIDELSEMEFSYFRMRGGITQALGGPLPPTIHIDQVPIYPGDRVLVCTDGIHDNLTDREIEEILQTGARTAVARILVEHALERSRQEREQTIRAKPDDMSAIVITCRF